MESSWTLNEKSTGELLVTVDGDAWKKAQKDALKQIKSRMNIKGFRKGQVPDALVKKQISKEYLYDVAVDKIANDALSFGMKEHDIVLVDRPMLNIKAADADKVELSFTCTVNPTVTLGDYKGLDIAKDAVEVTDEEVDAEIKREQERKADMVLRDEDEAAQMGDEVTIDFVGTIDGTEFEGGSGESYPLELGSNSFIPGFEEQVVGMKPGDVKDVNVTFPEDYQAEELAGKAAVFKVTAHDVKYKELPELNDEFVKTLKVEGVETVDQLKENKKASLTASKERTADDKFTTELLDAVTGAAQVEIPEVMINNEVENLFRNFESQMMNSGFTAEQYCQAMQTTVDELKGTFKPEAEKRVLNTLVLNEIAKQENIEVTDEDVEAEYNNLATTYGMDVDRVKAIVQKEVIKDDLAQQKALDLIKSSVK